MQFWQLAYASERKNPAFVSLSGPLVNYLMLERQYFDNVNIGLLNLTTLFQKYYVAVMECFLSGSLSHGESTSNTRKPFFQHFFCSVSFRQNAGIYLQARAS